MNALAQITNKTYPVVIAQYKRDDFTVGREDKFHWALLVITDKDTLTGHCFQAADKITDGNKTWETHYKANASLKKSSKGLGGVQIGNVKHRDLDKFVEAAKSHGCSSVAGWGCKNYVLELIELLKHKGLDVELPTITLAALLPDLKEVSRKTFDLSTAAKSFIPYVKFLA